MATAPRDGKLLYHLTHINNMESILRQGLVPRNQLMGNFVDTADPKIISGRHEWDVDLSDFVPFHFFVKNPYDGVVCKKHGAENMVIIAIKRPTQDYDGFYIIPNHPLSGKPHFLPYNEGFQEVKWELMVNGPERCYSNPIIKQACMAECDVNRPVPVEEFVFVYVKTNAAQNRILEFPNSQRIAQKIQVNPNMFPQF